MATSFSGNLFVFPLTKRETETVRNTYYKYLAKREQYKETDTLYNYYRKPSKTKILIWEYWRNKIIEPRIVSNNCQYITIGGLSKTFGEDYFVYITPRHNYIIRINDINTF